MLPRHSDRYGDSVVMGAVAIEICSCGHPVSKHVLWKTEYSRCEGIYTGQHLCRCSGLSRRTAVIVGLSGEWGGVGSRPGKFFRRDYRIESDGRYETFNRSVEKAIDNPDLFVEWATHTCERCGSDWDGPFTAYGALVGEDKELSVEFVCGICDFERQEMCRE